MLKFKSLTAKFIFISLIMFVILTVYFYVDFRFTHHMKGEAARINIAGAGRRGNDYAFLGVKVAVHVCPQNNTGRFLLAMPLGVVVFAAFQNWWYSQIRESKAQWRELRQNRR